MSSAHTTIRAPKGKPGSGTAKTTVNRVIPVTIKPIAGEFTVVLDGNGAALPGYPILTFDITGPPGWFFEVQVKHSDLAFMEGPGIALSWIASQDPGVRVRSLTFSSWSSGETALRLDGSGNARYTMPLEWWKDQARQWQGDFQSDPYFYRALAFPDSSGKKARFSTPNGKPGPAVTLHNNLVSFSQPINVDSDSYYNTGYGAHAENVVANRLVVKEADTWDMYCVVQWMRIIGRSRAPDGTITPLRVKLYGFSRWTNWPSEWSIDMDAGLDPRYRRNDRPDFHDHHSATVIDKPGSPVLPPNREAEFFYVDFETKAYLNCDIAGKNIQIKKQVGSPPVYDEIVGVLPDPQPAVLAVIEWKTRILIHRNPHATVLDVSHPDVDIDDMMIDPLEVQK